MLIAAADHGVAAQGVSAYPSAVTAQMCLNFCAGGAAVNVLARQAGAEVVVLDVGVAAELPARPGLITAKIAYGTADFTIAPAMTADQLQQALACHHRLTISHQQLQPQRRIQQAEQRLHQHPAAKHPWRLGQPVGPARATSQSRSREIAAAYVFVQPGAQLALKRRRERQVHGDR